MRFELAIDYPPTRGDLTELRLYEWLAELFGQARQTSVEGGRLKIMVLVPLPGNRDRLREAFSGLRAAPLFPCSLTIKEVE